MSDPTRIYNIYCYDAAEVSVFADQIEASSDEEAIALTEAQGFGSRCEIWDGDRLVAQLNAERRTG